MKRLLAGAVLAAIHFCAFAYDCFDASDLYQHVGPGILRAISIGENVRCDGTVRRNSNGSIDVGCMQSNSAHFEELAKCGIPREALQNQCANIFIGGWHYAVTGDFLAVAPGRCNTFLRGRCPRSCLAWR